MHSPLATIGQRKQRGDEPADVNDLDAVSSHSYLSAKSHNLQFMKSARWQGTRAQQIKRQETVKGLFDEGMGVEPIHATSK